jgi:hypothetical protein
MALHLGYAYSLSINLYLMFVNDYPGTLVNVNRAIIKIFEEKMKSEDFNKLRSDGVHNKFIVPSEFGKLETLYLFEILIKYYSNHPSSRFEDKGIVSEDFIR